MFGRSVSWIWSGGTILDSCARMYSHLASAQRQMASGASKKSQYSVGVKPKIDFASKLFQWPAGGTSYGHAPWNSLPPPAAAAAGAAWAGAVVAAAADAA